jgi:hypothetical protein
MSATASASSCPDALRPSTAQAAAQAKPKLHGRLSKEDKRNRERMAELARSTPSHQCRDPPAYVMARPDQEHATNPPPEAEHEWLTTSVADAAEVIAQVINALAATPPAATGSPWSTATATRSTLSAPRHAATTCRSPSSSTSCTCRTRSWRYLIGVAWARPCGSQPSAWTLRLRSVRTGGLS